jgi:hypothetical protein
MNQEGGNVKYRSGARALGAVLVILFAAGQAWAAMRPIPKTKLDRRSDVIVTGKVVGLKSYWNSEKTLIYTDVSIEPEEFIKGRMHRNAVIRVVGGEVGEMSLVVDEMPVFSLGEQVTVNLVKGRDEGVFEVLGGAQGKSPTLGGRPKPPPPLFYYDYSGYKRNPAVCNYYINQGLLDKGWEAALQRAGDSWSLAGSAFRFNDSGATSIRAAGFDGVNIISDSDFGATSSYWAVCYGFFRRKVLVEDDIIFNTQPTWYTYPEPYCPPEGGDVQNIGCHEMGHCLQLLDLRESYQSEQTMFWAASRGEIKKRSLDFGDRDGIKFIYPATP